MTGKILAINAGIAFVYMTAWFVAAKIRNRLDTVDIAWGLGYTVIAWTTYIQAHSTRSLVIAGLVTIWGLRLANHIWQRSKFRGDDPRYRELAEKWQGNVWARAYVSIFLLQGLLVWVIGLPIVMGTGVLLHGWEWLTVAGAIIWLTGFIIESIADKQLSSYLKLDPRPKVMDSGLWRYSRHPNYFGELTQWWGIGVIALQAAYGWVGLVGPLTLTVLILFVSGIPPIEKKRAKDAAYREYQRKTSPLVPLPPRR